MREMYAYETPGDRKLALRQPALEPKPLEPLADVLVIDGQCSLAVLTTGWLSRFLPFSLSQMKGGVPMFNARFVALVLVAVAIALMIAEGPIGPFGI